MLVIRDAQLQTFIAENNDDIVHLTAQALARISPSRIDGIRPIRLRAMIEKAVEKARSMSLTKAEEIAGFAFLMFEVSPQFAEQKDILHALLDESQPPDFRFDSLFERTTDKAWEEAVDSYDETFWFGGDPKESVVEEEGKPREPVDYIERTIAQANLLRELAEEFRSAPTEAKASRLEIETEKLCHFQTAAKGSPKVRAKQAFEHARSLLLGRAVTQKLPHSP